MNSADFQNGENVRKLRNAIHLSQEELALLFGVSMMTASKWERGVLHPDYIQSRAMTTLWSLADNNPRFNQAKKITIEARLQIRDRLHQLLLTKPLDSADLDEAKPTGSSRAGGVPLTKPSVSTRPQGPPRAKPTQKPLAQNCANCIQPKCVSNEGKANGGLKPDPTHSSTYFSCCGRGKWKNKPAAAKPRSRTSRRLKAR